jgi:hypothetical protein
MSVRVGEAVVDQWDKNFLSVSASQRLCGEDFCHGNQVAV